MSIIWLDCLSAVFLLADSVSMYLDLLYLFGQDREIQGQDPCKGDSGTKLHWYPKFNIQKLWLFLSN